MPSRAIEQNLSLKTQKVRPKAKRPKKNTPTHPMTMMLKGLVKHTNESFGQSTVKVTKGNVNIVNITVLILPVFIVFDGS